jgi:hypothetical protein
MVHIPIWVWLIALAYVAPKLYYALQVGRRRKGEVSFRLRRLVVGLIAYAGGAFIAIQTGHTPLESVAFAIPLGLAVSFFLVRPPSRNRVLPRHIRKAVIKRDLKGGDFDATIHHIDHIVPYSKGGDHSMSNLRVLPKKENLKRGAKMPKMKDFRRTS